jgi:hypothetical protein
MKAVEKWAMVQAQERGKNHQERLLCGKSLSIYAEKLIAESMHHIPAYLVVPVGHMAFNVSAANTEYEINPFNMHNFACIGSC